MNQNTAESPARLRIYAFIPFVLSLIFAVQYYRTYVAGTAEYALDFGLYYNAAKAFTQGQWGAIYDTVTIQNYMQGTAPHFHPFINPPWALVILSPLAVFPQTIALPIWYLVGIMLLLYAIKIVRHTMNAPKWHITLMLAAPHIVVGFVSAQAGWVLCGLFIIAMLNHARFPIWAGLAFALAGAIKPHMAIVFTVLFLGLGQWRILLSTAVWALLILAISILVLPYDIWPHYLVHMQFAAEVLKVDAYDYGRLSLLALKIWGLPYDLVMIIHIISALCVLTIIFINARKYGASLRLYSMAAVGVFLVSPYGYMYDTPLLLIPLLFWWHSAQLRKFSEMERLTFIFISALPVLLTSLQTLGIPAGPISLLLAMWVLMKSEPKLCCCCSSEVSG